MKLVVDTNVLLTFFWPESVARKVFPEQHLELSAPEFALEEIKKHTAEIMKKTKLSSEQFSSIRKEMALTVEFIPLEEYKTFLPQAAPITPDKNDIDFVALSIKLNCPLWSNDHMLAHQAHFKVLTTKEIIDLLAAEKANDY